MRLAVGPARLDVKADMPLPAGTPVLIEVEQPAPAMLLKVSADETALQGRSLPQGSAGQRGASTATGQAASAASLQALQLKSATALAQAAGGATPAQAAIQTGTAQARPVLANVDLSTFVLLKADTNAPAAAPGPTPQASASNSPVTGVATSGSAAGGQSAAPVPAGGRLPCCPSLRPERNPRHLPLRTRQGVVRCLVRHLLQGRRLWRPHHPLLYRGRLWEQEPPDLQHSCLMR